jgi:hypothetical protein
MGHAFGRISERTDAMSSNNVNTIQGMNSITPDQIVDVIQFTPRDKAIVFQGPPGVGKTFGFYQYIEVSGDLYYEDSWVNALPEDTKGIPTKDEEGNEVVWLTPSWFKRFSYDLRKQNADGTWPEGEGPDDSIKASIFIDEFFSAPTSVQICGQKIAQERILNMRKLHPNVRVILAGNRVQDKAGVKPMPLPLRSKVTFWNVECELGQHYPASGSKGWIHNYAIPKGLHPEVIAFLRMKGHDFFMDADGDKYWQAYPCPRSWETTSDYLCYADKGDTPLAILEGQVAGAISPEVASEFFGWREIFKDIPTLEEIVSNPEKAKHSKEPSFMYAVTGMLESAIKSDSKVLEPALIYCRKNQPDFRMILLGGVKSAGPKAKKALAKLLTDKKYKDYMELIENMHDWEG